jgi:hypothetical protein
MMALTALGVGTFMTVFGGLMLVLDRYPEHLALVTAVATFFSILLGGWGVYLLRLNRRSAPVPVEAWRAQVSLVRVYDK